MSKEPTTTEPTTDLVDDASVEVSERTVLSGTMTDAIKALIAGTDPIQVGDHGLLLRVPAAHEIRRYDKRDFEDLPDHVSADQRFVSIESLAHYVALHQTEDTNLYASAVCSADLAPLAKARRLATAAIDDHGPGGRPNYNAHTAVLVTAPTSAAQRWAAALHTPTLSQEEFLDLVVDGIGEIAAPDGAVLRDLVSNLHSISTSSVESVMRTGGQGQIVVSENVSLSSGPGTKVPFPETMTVVLTPFRSFDQQVSFTVRIKPLVNAAAEKITFALTAPDLPDVVTSALETIATQAGEAMGLTPLFTT